MSFVPSIDIGNPNIVTFNMSTTIDCSGYDYAMIATINALSPMSVGLAAVDLENNIVKVSATGGYNPTVTVSNHSVTIQTSTSAYPGICFRY